MFKCKYCGRNSKEFNQDQFTNGRLDEYLAKKIEDDFGDLEVGDIIYYYFEGKDEEIIRGNQNAAATPRGYCEECIRTTIEDTFISKDPHYGDGVYFSKNDNLINSQKDVKCCHGDYVSKRTMRVKFVVIKPTELEVIKNTGGVLKTVEGYNHYDDNVKIFANKLGKNKIIRFLDIEEYVNNSWRSKR